MTNKERAIVMAYTGTSMLCGNKFQIFHEYVENIMGRPVYTHELANKGVQDEIKEKAKADFIALCADDETSDAHKMTIKALEQVDVLNKIREEIQDNTYFINEVTEKEGIDFETVEKIIDKYITESEVER